MLTAYPFGAFAPDVAQKALKQDDGSYLLSEALNALPVPGGYRPARGFLALTSALPAGFQGGAAFIGSDGTSSLIAGDATDLYLYDGADWNSVLDSLTAGRWYFAQFGDNAIAANGGDLLAYDLLAGTAAAISGAPTAAHVATVRDFVVALEPDGDELSVQWSGFNDSAGWTDGVNQSGSQGLLSGGAGVAVVGGEYGIVLQKNAVKRMTYVGVPVVFQFDEISVEIGCMARGSVANVGRLIFFLSERGFQVCDGNEVRPIGNEKVDRTFFDTYSREDIAAIWAAIDPQHARVLWAMPGGKIWAYYWQLDRWTTLQVDVVGIFTGFTSNISIEALDAIYGDLDSIPYSLDDPRFSGGNPLLLIANAAGEVGSFAGDNLAATLTLPNIEPAAGRRARVRSARPVCDAAGVSAVLDARLRRDDATGAVSTSAMRANGQMPLRANGRYFNVATTIDDAGWTSAEGIELFFEPAGLR